ncbi:putative Adenylate isopentenyltransferase 5, chloroplastic [Cocos nucifera]|uniref:Putative Adenylate isopentenyltransferase 5, chloroplastic n=1 Tax=Cocos nucifera TaxID=13894 RepID=A0A8K0ND16_COCNU|nr:putative Adenylate isopentenyltransferase 5, chloroplastic [Cocos nucifera]
MATGTVDPVEDPNTNPNPNDGRDGGAPVAKKVVVVMGPTGAGKSRLAIDLASHFTGVEVVNADSMQVYRGLDVLTNKVPLSERNGVPHHLLGTIDASVEFTSKDFRDLAIHVNRYLSLYASSGVLPSNLFQGEVAEFSLNPEIMLISLFLTFFKHSERVDCMIDAGLLDEVYDIYHSEADYTRGLRQAIGVREFEAFFRCYFSKKEDSKACRLDFSDSLHSDDDLKILLDEAIDKLKANTCKLARRQVNEIPPFLCCDL